MSEEDEKVCVDCGGTPCEWDELGPDLLERVDLMHRREKIEGVTVVVDDNGNRVENGAMRKAIYRMFTYIKFGHLGRGQRIPIPVCVLREIRNMYPERDGDYMGFKEAPEIGGDAEREDPPASPQKQTRRRSKRLIELSNGREIISKKRK